MRLPACLPGSACLRITMARGAKRSQTQAAHKGPAAPAFTQNKPLSHEQLFAEMGGNANQRSPPDGAGRRPTQLWAKLEGDVGDEDEDEGGEDSAGQPDTEEDLNAELAGLEARHAEGELSPEEEGRLHELSHTLDRNSAMADDLQFSERYAVQDCNSGPLPLRMSSK
eukprot:SAG22_NODE_5229_length_1057_cov_1.397704_1_plen_167_part_10